MKSAKTITLRRLLPLGIAFLIVRVTAEVVWGYRNYLPPNFSSDFLQGRENYFFGSYQWAFYPHIAVGPLTLLLGMVLVSDKFRLKFPIWHRWLGRVQAMSVIFVIGPSGLWMAYYTATGRIAGIGFAILSILTTTCAVMGWKTAVARRFNDHRRWMSRCFVLLCSAVVLRILGGLGTVLEVKFLWYDPIASWSSWLIPLLTFEYLSLRNRRPALVQPRSVVSAQ